MTREDEGNIYNIYKPAGWTPQQAIERLRLMHPEWGSLKIACAGRLDPMAEGVLIVLAGDALKRFDEFCGLDKKYEAEILFGLESDSQDIMGVVREDKELRHIGKEEIENVLNELKGELKFPVPAYSSWRVQGKALYWWARQGRLGEIEIPIHKCLVLSNQLLGVKNIEVSEVKQWVWERLNVVQGDFRQEKIKAQWESILDERQEL